MHAIGIAALEIKEVLEKDGGFELFVFVLFLKFFGGGGGVMGVFVEASRGFVELS